MTLTRRRFLTISAAFAATPAAADTQRWQGRAFGADVGLTLHGPKAQATAALAEARQIIARVERLFSLYDPQSALSTLNATGVLRDPDPQFTDVMQACDRAFAMTDGLFDPTVQPLWQALAQGRDTTAARASIGWRKVQHDSDLIRLAPGQALTFNGIAQGYATDQVARAFAARGLTDTLVNLGEYHGSGRRWRLGIGDPVHGVLGHRTVANGAIATSSPAATLLGDQGHILHAQARPQWSTVAVEAQSAALADSLSTALVLASRDRVEAVMSRAGSSRVTLVGFDGDLVTLLG